MQLKPAESTSGDFVIDRLEDMLTRAKAGAIVNFMLASVNTDGTVGSVWANGDQPYLLLGANDVLKAEFMHAETEMR